MTALKASISNFEATVARAEINGDLWAVLVENNAPRLLGDVFLAAVAAVVQDSNWRQAKSDLEQLIRDHVDRCRPAIEPMQGALPTLLTIKSQTDSESPVEMKKIQDAVEDLEVTQVIEPAIMNSLNEVAGLAPFAFTDLHFCECEGNLYAATSPRVAIMKCAFERNERRPKGPADGANKELGGALGTDKDALATGVENGPVYCTECEIPLNGPVQYEEHKMGKKHKKNVKRCIGKPNGCKACDLPPTKRAADEKVPDDAVARDPVAGAPPMPYTPPPQGICHPCPQPHGRDDLTVHYPGAQPDWLNMHQFDPHLMHQQPQCAPCMPWGHGFWLQ